MQAELCLKIAEEAHKGQKRRGGEDYIEHPKRVASAFGIYTAEHCIALLHDVLEDTETTCIDLYNKIVNIDIVEGTRMLDKSNYKTYEDYIVEISRHNSLRLIKIHDILDNLSDDPTKEQVKKYSEALKILAK